MAVALYRFVRPNEVLRAGPLPNGPNLGQGARSILRKDDAIELARLCPVNEEENQESAVTSIDAVGGDQILPVHPLVKRSKGTAFADTSDPIAVRPPAKSP
jgi:hypothetical protein